MLDTQEEPLCYWIFAKFWKYPYWYIFNIHSVYQLVLSLTQWRIIHVCRLCNPPLTSLRSNLMGSMNNLQLLH